MLRIVGLSALTSACTHNLSASDTCARGWDKPRTLAAADGRPAYVESPIALRDSGSLLLLGTPAFIWANRDEFDPPPAGSAADTAAYFSRLHANHGFFGFRLDSSGIVVPVPRWFEGYDRKISVVQDDDTSAHLIWLAPANSMNSDGPDATIWYVERWNSRWTSPRIVFSADRLDWSGHKAEILLRDARQGAREVDILVSYDREQTKGIALVREINGTWMTNEFPISGLPTQVSARYFHSDSLAVVYAGVGFRGARERNGQHIFLVRVGVADTVWPTGKLIEWSGLDNIRWVQLFNGRPTLGASRQLKLVWTLVRATPGSTDTLYSMLSGDGGVTWSTPQKKAVPFRIAVVDGVQGSNGEIHLVVVPAVQHGGQNTTIYHAVSSEGNWRDLIKIDTDRIDSKPSLSSVGVGQLLLTWGTARSADPNRPTLVAPISQYSIFRKQCLPGG